MEKDNLVYIYLILDSIHKIKDYVLNMSHDDFSIDNKTQSAVIMQLQVRRRTF